jgi:hypothetical protein
MEAKHVNQVCTEFINIHISVKFKLENECDRKLNVLDITVHRKYDNLDFTMYRKPTVTDIIIHNFPCHPNEHRMASIHYLMNVLHTYHIVTSG